jgi:hypothetical protein
MIYGDQAFGSSLLFYLRRRIYLVYGRTTLDVVWFAIPGYAGDLPG